MLTVSPPTHASFERLIISRKLQYGSPRSFHRRRRGRQCRARPVGAIVGRLVGAVAGNVIDQALFGARRNLSLEGPRLNDLTVMASTEGAPIARVYALLNVRFGSFATELVKVDAGTSPLRSESDRNIAVPRMNAIAKSGPTTPASGCISCRGYQASDFNH